MLNSKYNPETPLNMLNSSKSNKMFAFAYSPSPNMRKYNFYSPYNNYRL